MNCIENGQNILIEPWKKFSCLSESDTVAIYEDDKNNIIITASSYRNYVKVSINNKDAKILKSALQLECTDGKEKMINNLGFVSTIDYSIIDIDFLNCSYGTFLVCLNKNNQINIWRYIGDDFEYVLVINCGSLLVRAKKLICHKVLDYICVSDVNGTVKIYSHNGVLIRMFTNLANNQQNITAMRLHDTKAILCVGTNNGLLCVLDIVRNLIIGKCLAHSSIITDIALVDVILNKRVVNIIIVSCLNGCVKMYSADSIVKKLCATFNDNNLQIGVNDKNSKNDSIDISNKIRELLLDKNEYVELDYQLTINCEDEVNCILILNKDQLHNYLTDKELINSNESSFYLLTGHPNGTIVLWNLINKKKLVILPDNNLLYNFAIISTSAYKFFSMAKKKLFAVFGADKSFLLWELGNTIAPTMYLQNMRVESYKAISVKGKDNTVKIYFVQNNGTIGVKDIDVRRHSCTTKELLTRNELSIVTFDYSINNNYLAYAYSNGEIEVVNLDTATKIYSIHSNIIGPVLHICISKCDLSQPKSFNTNVKPFIITIGADSIIRKWQIEEKKNVDSSDFIAKASEKSVYCAIIDKSDKYIAIGGVDKFIKIFDTCNLTLLFHEKAHKGTITALEFSSNSKLLFSAGTDDRLCVWRLHKGNINSLVLKKVFLSARSSIVIIKYFDDINIVAAGCNDGKFIIWDYTAANTIATVYGTTEPVISIEYLQIGDILCFLVYYADGTSILYRNDYKYYIEIEKNKEQLKRTVLGALDILLRDENYLDAINLAITEKNHIVLQEILKQYSINELKKTGNSANLTNNLKDIMVNYINSNDQIENYLILVTKLISSYKTNNLAFWMINCLINSNKIMAATKIIGFNELCAVYNKKLNTQLGRLESQLEKSYLVNTIIDQNIF